MKKIKIFVCLLAFCLMFSSAFAEGADIVVLMDTSGTILPWFDDINNKVLIDVTKKFIRLGDTFHLISFNSRVNLEIVQPIKNESDISRIVSRFMLLYPLGQNSDFISGLNYTWRYVSSLDHEKEKYVIVISDGIFNPPETSSYAQYTPEQVKSEIAYISHQIRGAGWHVYYIKLPFPENADIFSLNGTTIQTIAKQKNENASTPSSATNETQSTPSSQVTKPNTESKQYYDVSSEFTADVDISPSQLPKENIPLTFVDTALNIPKIIFPEDIGRTGRMFTLSLKVENTAPEAINMELTGVYYNKINILTENSFLKLTPNATGVLRAKINLPETISTGAQTIPVSLKFSDDMRVMPQSGELHLTITNFSIKSLFRSGSTIVIIVLAILLALLFVIAFFIFLMHKLAQPATEIVRTASEPEAERPIASDIPTATVEYPKDASVLVTAKNPSPILQQPIHGTDFNTTQILSAYATGSQTQKNTEANTGTVEKTVISAQQPKQQIPSSSDALKSLLLQQESDKNAKYTILSAAQNKAATRQSRLIGASATESIPIVHDTHIMLELFVHNQNPNVGKRNIHMMKAGTRLTLGGRNSPFLVFLVKFPPRIAELRFDGKTCKLAILKPEYFPHETTNIISDCINKPIQIVSDHDYEVTFEFRIYESPVLRLNRLLTSIQY